MDAGEYHSDETGSPLISHLHYKQSGKQRKQQGTGKVDLQGSSELAFGCAQNCCGWQWFSHSCVNQDDRFRTLHCINERKQRWETHCTVCLCTNFCLSICFTVVYDWRVWSFLNEGSLTLSSPTKRISLTEKRKGVNKAQEDFCTLGMLHQMCNSHAVHACRSSNLRSQGFQPSHSRI